MNVILLGYRGSGKSSIGRKLADQLWKDFVDVDAEVRKRFDGRSIAEIWQAWGEPAFRQAEAEATAALLERDNQVIALGGGTVMHEQARAAIAAAEDCKRVYLACDASVLAERIAADAATGDQRPPLTAGSDAADEVRQVLAERDPVYREVADIVFDVSFCSIDEAVRHLIGKL